MSEPEKTICFVADRPGWAFDRSVGNLMRALDRRGVRSRCCYQTAICDMFDEEFVYACWWPDAEIIKKRLRPGQRLLCRLADMATWSRHAPVDWQKNFQRVASMVDVFITASREIDESLRSCGIQNSFVVGDSVDVDEFTGADHSAEKRGLPVVGWCGNPMALSWLGFEDIKGLSVVSTLVGRRDLKFVTATELHRTEMPHWYRSIDAYVCASRLEGTPLPVLEAMSAEKVIISTSVGVVPEIRSPGVFLFDGTVTGLMKAVTDVLQQRAKWESLGKANRSYVQNHRSATVMGEKLRRVLFRF